MNSKTKLVYIVKRTNNLNTIIHSTRRGKDLEFSPKQISQEGKNILTENIKLNLIKIGAQQKWKRFENLKEVNLYQTIKQEITEKFEKYQVPFKVRQNHKYLTQYIVSLSPEFWDQNKIIEYKVMFQNGKSWRWGTNQIINQEKLTNLFDVIISSIQKERAKNGVNNFIASIIHLDEKTPHIHIFFTDIIKDKEKYLVSKKSEIKHLIMRDKIKASLYKEHDLKIHEEEKMNHKKWMQKFEKLAAKSDDKLLQPLPEFKIQNEKIKKWERENLFQNPQTNQSKHKDMLHEFIEEEKQQLLELTKQEEDIKKWERENLFQEKNKYDPFQKTNSYEQMQEKSEQQNPLFSCFKKDKSERKH